MVLILWNQIQIHINSTKSHTWIPNEADSADKDPNDWEFFKLNPLWNKILLDFKPKREEGTGHLGHGTENDAIFLEPTPPVKN